MVVMKGEAITAGSKPIFLASSGRHTAHELGGEHGAHQRQADDGGYR